MLRDSGRASRAPYRNPPASRATEKLLERSLSPAEVQIPPPSRHLARSTTLLARVDIWRRNLACNALYCTVRHPRNLDHTISRLFGLLPSHTSAAQLLAPLDCTPRTAMTSQPTTERPPLHLQTSSPSPKVPLLPSPFSLHPSPSPFTAPTNTPLVLLSHHLPNPPPQSLDNPHASHEGARNTQDEPVHGRIPCFPHRRDGAWEAEGRVGGFECIVDENLGAKILSLASFLSLRIMEVFTGLTVARLYGFYD